MRVVAARLIADVVLLVAVVPCAAVSAALSSTIACWSAVTSAGRMPSVSASAGSSVARATILLAAARTSLYSVPAAVLPAPYSLRTERLVAAERTDAWIAETRFAAVDRAAGSVGGAAIGAAVPGAGTGAAGGKPRVVRSAARSPIVPAGRRGSTWGRYWRTSAYADWPAGALTAAGF